MKQFSIISLCVLFLFAQGKETGAEASRIEIRRNLVYADRESGPLGMDVYLPRGAGPFPGVLVVHGGAWMIGTRLQLASFATALAEHGYTAAAISYRLAPRHRFPAQLSDCQAAVRWLRGHAGELKIDPERIGGYGYSAGGQLVALLGALDNDSFREEGVAGSAPSARLQTVVAGGAPCDFRVMPADSARLAYWLGGTRAALPDLYRLASPAAFVSPDDPPMFFFHGAKDSLVPIDSPQRMVELLRRTGVAAQMHTIENQGHMLALFDGESLRLALEFLDRHLKRPPVVAAEASLPLEPAPKGGATDGQ